MARGAGRTGWRFVNADAPKRVPRLDSLTGLRWFAALAVFVYHSSQRAPIPKVHLLAPAGEAGVAFFFILSGFVLSWSFSPKVPAAIFYWRRFARVWPLLAFSTVAAFFVLHQSWSVVGGRLMLSLAMIQAWFPAGDVFGNPVAWSLSCEAFFYLVFPFLIRPLTNARGRTIVGLVAGLLLLEWAYRMWAWRMLAPLEPSHSLMLARLPVYRLVEFLLGVTAAVAVRRGWRSPVGVRLSIGVLALSVLTVWHGVNAGWWSAGWYDQGLTPAMVLLIAATASRDLNGAASIFRRRPLIALGEWSYAFYLVHLLVIWGLAGRGAPMPASWANLVPVVAWLLLAVLASAACFRFIERPAERRLRALFPVRDDAKVGERDAVAVNAS